MILTEKVKLSTRSRTPEGFLKATAAVTSVGVQDYLGREIDESLPPYEKFGVFRGPETVFNDQTLSSLKLKPVTLGHPPNGEFVTSDNSGYMPIVGTVGEKITKIDEKRLGASVLITDDRAIDVIEKINPEVSLAYICPIVEDDGEFEGRRYRHRFDGPMQINHLALTGDVSGRAGESVKILDTNEGKMSKKETKKMADVDMTALVTALSDKLLPKAEEILSSEAFLNKLAEMIGSSMITQTSESVEVTDEVDESDADITMPDDDMIVDEDLDKKMVTDPGNHSGQRMDSSGKKINKLKQLKLIMDQKITKKVDLLEKARFFDTEVEARMSDREILSRALKSNCSEKDLKSRSIEFLRGQLEVLAGTRQRAQSSMHHAYADTATATQGNFDLEMPSAIDLLMNKNRRSR